MEHFNTLFCGDSYLLKNSTLFLQLNLSVVLLLQVLPYPLYFHAACVTPAGCMYVFGGVKSLDSEFDCRSSDIHKLWLTVPPLAELCWERLISCIPSILSKDVDMDGLPKLGFLPHFLSRIM